ncbi:protein-tyrosine-phosphatase MKP1-like [Henckelia pumila]|uniref:protein-tyrosine-phosphatase MKP1-like n=1 Tax=Henckelia pumila TaxID=405737 RepID=UPI003C6DD50B
MLGEEKDLGPNRIGKTYSRSISLIECPPKKSNSKPQWNSKARACLPPLQPLSITRPSSDEWPKAGFDDLGIWVSPPTPGARLGSLTPRENSTVDRPQIEFEFRKDKLAFFDKECSRILDHVYLGSNAVAKNRAILRQNGITHVLNCVGFVCPEYFKNELVYMTLWLQDCPSEDITSLLYDVFDYFEDVREQGGRVFVHCCQGVSRSASLVIAYLIWKKGQSFEDAFQHVKAARGVTNPNVGFACQLLQIEKRVHALPASPASVLRMYRMAPHSPYDPLHLVPKLLCESGPDRLDSRGGFIIHVPSTLYVWIGKHCPPMMSNNTMAAASQVVRYESVGAPVIIVKEVEEPSEFWDAIYHGKSSADGCRVKSSSEERKLNEYDLDFEMFHRALTGGVIPPFSETGTETCLPSRKDDWNKLRKKFASDFVKESMASISNCGSLQVHKELDVINTSKEVLEDSVDTCKEDSVSTDDLSTPSSSRSDSPDSFSSCVTSSPVWNEKMEFPDPLYDTSLSRSPSFSLLDSFTSCLVSKSYSSSTSPSLSPSASDSSSSFSLSPSSSNSSDTSFVSAQTVAYELETIDAYPSKSGSVEEIVGPVDNNTRWLFSVASPQTDEAFSNNNTSRTKGLCSASGENFTLSTSIDEASHVSENSARPLCSFAEDDAMSDVECNILSREASFEMVEEYPISDANSYVAEDEVLDELQVEQR